MRKWVNWSIFGLVGLLLAIATLIFHYFILPIAIRYQVTKTLELKNGTEAWDRFVNTPIPVMLNVYFFNLDNPEGVLQGETPKVTQVGPYVYREKWEKVDIRIDEERDTIFYRQKIDFEFDQKQSGSLSDKDIVSIINPVVHVVTKIIDGLQALNLTNEVIEFALPTMARENYGPVFTASVHDILLGGVRIHCSGNLPFIVKFLCAAFKRFLPLPYLSLADNGDLMAAIFKFKELGPVMELNRGSRDPNMIGRIVSMDGRRKLTSWKCDSANIVDGYDMTMLSPFNKRTSIPLFTYDLQSTLQMQYETDVSFEGIGGYRFVLAPDVFGDPATNPKSRCYCPGSIKNLTIPPPCMKGSGVLDVSSCIGAKILKEMKPLLYHLEYHLENGYFDRFPKGQAIKMVVGNDGGVQTLYGRGTGSGKIMVSSGKSVLFAMDKSKEELKVVFRAYSDDKLIGEAVKIFKETSFPKRTEVGEPASYTFGSDLGFRKGTELVGAVKSFIRMTSFGENITSDCIKDGESYRVRMTSLIVERNKDPRKNVKPWWVILDGRRLRFSRWLRALEKEDCAKDVFLNVKKCSDVGNLPSISEASINKEEIAAFESAEAALKKDFDFIREFGSQATFDKGSQVDLSVDPSFYGFQLSSYTIKSNEKCCCGQNKVSTTSSIQADSPNFEKESEVKNSFGETILSSEKQPSITPSPNSQIKESEFFVNEHDKNSQNQQNTNDLICLDFNQTNDNDCDTNISEQKKRNHESNVKNYKKTKADEIFHFERSTSDLFGENASTGSSGMKSLISEEIYTSDCEVESPIVTEKSFLAETIVREIIDVIIESVFEREYRSLEEHALDELVTATKEDSDNKVVRVVGYGDTESLMDLSVLGVVKTSASVDLSKPKNHNVTSNRSTTSFDENEEDNEEQHSPKTILICSNQMQKERSDEECSSKNCRENQYIRTNDLRQESDVSCILIKCNDQSDLEDLHYCRPRENSVGSCSVRNESNEGLSDAQLYHKNMAGYRKPTRSTVDNCVSEWVKEDVITPCFTCDEETKDDMIHRERWRRTIITNDTCFVGSAESSCLPRPEDECRPEIIYSSDELQSVQLMSSNAYHSTHAESESNSSFQDKVSTTNTLVSQLTNDRSQEIKFMEEFQGNAKTSELIDPDFILKNKRSTSSSSASDNEFSPSEHAQQK